MTSKKVVSTWPVALKTSDVATNAITHNHVAEVLVGKTTWLHEFATGQAVSGSQTPQIPMNPQGRYGHDHSGPPYGAAIQHAESVFFTMGTGIYSGDWTKEFPTLILGNNGRPFARQYNRIWVKPFPKWIEGTPYSKAYLSVYAKSQTSTQTMLVKAANVTTTGVDDRESLPRYEVNNAVGPFYATDWTEALDVLSVDVAPGMNTICIDFTIADASNKLTVIGYAWGQTKKISQTFG